MTIVVCGAQSRTDTQTQQRVCVWNRVRGLGDAHFPHHFLLPVFAVCAVLWQLGPGLQPNNKLPWGAYIGNNNVLEHNLEKHYQKSLSTKADPYPQLPGRWQARASQPGCQGTPKLTREDRRDPAGAAGAVSLAESEDECTSGASNELGLVIPTGTAGVRGPTFG
jgi:hypothetical protein